MRNLRTLLVLCLIASVATACTAEVSEPLEDLFPGQVGDFLRTSGPGVDPETETHVATYEGPAGSVLLHIRRVGADQVEHTLSELPPTAAGVGYDPSLGQRSGVFFTFADEFHAAWGNGDWVFVLSASNEAARITFLSVYGY